MESVCVPILYLGGWGAPIAIEVISQLGTFQHIDHESNLQGKAAAAAAAQQQRAAVAALEAAMDIKMDHLKAEAARAAAAALAGHERRVGELQVRLRRHRFSPTGDLGYSGIRGAEG
jgi:hypothetical protein